MVSMPMRDTNKIWINVFRRNHGRGIACQKRVDKQFDAIRFDPKAGMAKPAQSSCHHIFSIGSFSDYGSRPFAPSQFHLLTRWI
jgi:hypothetical protein